MAKNRDKRGKQRVDFRPNIQDPARVSSSQWTRKHHESDEALEDETTQEAVKGKGPLARKRTVDLDRRGHLIDLQQRADEPARPESERREGTVLAVHGQFAKVDDSQRVRNCVVRRVLKSLMLDQRNVIAVGDQVHFTAIDDDEGVIEQIGQRRGMLFRRYRQREHLIVANVDRLLIVSSVAAPELRIHLIDRYIVAGLAGELAPVIIFNKIDLPHDEPLDDYERVYSRLGYPTLRTSAVDGTGVEQLRELMKDHKSVLAGVSGVGKSSLINALDPDMKLKTRPVNRATRRGQHTTTTVSLLKFAFGGYVVDTPGIRQFAFSNIDRRNLEAHFEEFVPHIRKCKFPDCTHTHEHDCAVKQAVEEGQIAAWRYDSYVKIFEDQGEFLARWER